MTDYRFDLPADDIEVTAGASSDPTAPVQLTIDRLTLRFPVEVAEQVIDGLVDVLAVMERAALVEEALRRAND